MDFQLQLDTETVAHAYPEQPVCVAPETPLQAVLATLKTPQARGCVLVCDQEQLVGIFTERDALKAMAAATSLATPIESLMHREVVKVPDTSTVQLAITTMAEGGYRHLPLVDAAGRPVGLLAVAGILHYLVQHFPKVIYTLPPQPHHSTQQREGA